jgi:hypothetical protein
MPDAACIVGTVANVGAVILAVLAWAEVYGYEHD